MQALDDLRVCNYTKNVLGGLQKKQFNQIYAFQQQQQNQQQVQGQRGERLDAWSASDIDSDEEDIILPEETKQEGGEDGEEEARQEIAPVPDNLLNFEDEVERILQNFLEAEQQTDMLMPTINVRAACIKEKEFKQVVSKANKRAGTTLVDNESAAGRAAARMNHPNAQRNSLLMVQNSYDDRLEKLNLREKKTRKVFQPGESVFELQDMYRINDEQGEEQEKTKMHQTARGRATYNHDVDKLRVYLNPRIYRMRDLEMGIAREFGSASTYAQELKQFLNVVPNLFKTVPYASAKLFHNIVTNGFFLHGADGSKNLGDNPHKEALSKYYEDSDDETNTRVSWGTFLPQSIRSMLLNMSRYFYDDLLSGDGQANFVASEKLFGAIKVFIQHSAQNNELFESKSPLQLHWSFLQVLKVLYEGQARTHQSVETLKKVCEPVFNQVAVSVLRQELAQMTELDSSLLTSRLQIKENAPESSNVDELRRILFDPRPHYCITRNQGDSDSEDLSMEGLMSGNSGLNKNKQVNFHDRSMPSEIRPDIFDVIGRVMPKPMLNFEEKLLEPLTSVFAEYQTIYNSKLDEDPKMKGLPDCQKFQFELVSANMLLEDMFAPPGRIDYLNERQTEAAIDVAAISSQQTGGQVVTIDSFHIRKFRNLMTDKVIEVCSMLLDNLEKRKAEVPIRLTYIIKLLLNEARDSFSVDHQDARLIADFFVGNWLSNAFRWPEVFGLQPAFKEEALTQGHLMMACRLVLETAMSCRQLPYTSKAHKTYNVTKLNSWIAEQSHRVLAYYTNIMTSVDVDSISSPTFKEAKSYNLSASRVPNELFETTVMRVQDMATLVKLTYAQFYEDHFKKDKLEQQLDLGADLVFRKNPPNVLRARVRQLKETKSKAVSVSSSIASVRGELDILAAVMAHEEQQDKKVEQFCCELSLIQRNNLDFWTNEQLDEYERFYDKFMQNHFSFDLSWPCINENYNPACYIEPDHKLANFFLTRQGDLQKGLFRIKKSGNHSYGQPQQDMNFKNELFENQFVSLYAFQKHETVKKKLDKEKVRNKQKQLWAFVEKHFDYGSTHERLREPSRQDVLRQITGHSTTQKTLATISEAETEYSYADESMMGPDVSSEYDMLTEVDSNYPEGLLPVIDEEDNFANRNSYDEESKSMMHVSQITADTSSGIRVPTAEEIKNDSNDNQLQNKMHYVDAISRVFYHLRGALEEHNFLSEQMSQRLQLARVIPDPNANDGTYENEVSINLEDLFKSVLEDDRHQPDQSMQLQLDAFLIKRYFSKLDPQMQKSIMELLKRRNNFVEQMMDFNFERQNFKLDRVLSFSKQFHSTTNRRIGLYDKTYDSLKVNRFICKSWGTNIRLRNEDLNEMIRQAYLEEVQQLRTIHHHQTVVENQRPQGTGRLSKAKQESATPGPPQRQNTLIEAMLSSRNSLRIDSLLGSMSDEQDQLDRMYDGHQSFPLEQIEDEWHQRVSARQSCVAEMTSSLLLTQEMITLDIKTISSNLLYASTMFNRDFIKRRVKIVDLETFTSLTSVMDSTDDHFLIFDMYKIFSMCAGRVLTDHSPGQQLKGAGSRMQSGATPGYKQARMSGQDARNFKFLQKVLKVFLGQLVSRIWAQLKNDTEMLEKDQLIRQYFLHKNAKNNLIENDMDLLDLSDSDNDSVMGLSTEDTSDDDIYAAAIQIMLSITETNCLDQQTATIERSILTAMRAYNQSNMMLQKSAVNAEALDRILEHVVGACYLRKPDFSLHLNLVFVVVILTKKSQSCSSQIKSLSKYLGQLLKTIKAKQQRL